MRRPQSNPYEVSVCEREGTGQFDTLRTEGFDWDSRQGSDLVDVVAADLIVLHVAYF